MHPLLTKLSILLLLTALSTTVFSKNSLNANAFATALKEAKYKNIKLITGITDMPDYTTAITTHISAEGAPRLISGYSGHSTHQSDIFSLPTVFYFPDKPDQDPIKAQIPTLNILAEAQQEVLKNIHVKIHFNALNGKNSKLIVYGQEVVKNIKTTLTYNKTNFSLTSDIDISDMSQRKAASYFLSYANIVGKLNHALVIANRDQSRKIADRKYQDYVKYRKQVLKQAHTQINDSEVFEILVEQANKDSREEGAKSEFGHWSSVDSSSVKGHEIFVDLINYGNYYEHTFYVFHSKAISQSKDTTQRQVMIAKMQKAIGNKKPIGASKVEIKSNLYSDAVGIVSTYSFKQGVKGKTIQKNSIAYEKFIKKHYKKLKKIANKY